MMFLAFAVVLAYLVLGAALLNRGMSYARSHALLDPQYLSMAVTDGRSLSMTLPKVAFVLFWLPTLLIALLIITLRRAMQPAGRAMAA